MSEGKAVPGFKFDTYIGRDGVPVVHVDTPEEWDDDDFNPLCRIYINEHLLHGPPLDLEKELANLCPECGADMWQTYPQQNMRICIKCNHTEELEELLETGEERVFLTFPTNKAARTYSMMMNHYDVDFAWYGFGESIRELTTFEISPNQAIPPYKELGGRLTNEDGDP